MPRKNSTGAAAGSVRDCVARLPHCRITGIIKGRQNITVVTAMKLARVFGQTPGYWLNLQRFYDVAKAEDEIGEELAAILPIVEKHDATSVAA
ncbi:MAG: HigA family addiction module antidote protein [Puniceicoccales bacterium]|jgi:plasmid maintenance system antidote protein VapI|nr:HigA family addiction module antidote protein [Puniceicoccales bacterium]